MDGATAWRRWLGLVFLALAFGMLVWGQTVLKPRLEGLAFLLYWSGCFAFTLLAIATALLDILLVRRRHRRERRDLVQRTFDDLHQLGKERPEGSETPPRP